MFSVPNPVLILF